MRILLLLIILLMTSAQSFQERIPVAAVAIEEKPKEDPAVIAIKAASDYARLQASYIARQEEMQILADKEVSLGRLELERQTEFRLVAQAACGTDSECFKVYYEKLIQSDRDYKEFLRQKAREETWSFIKGIGLTFALLTGASILISR